MPTYDFYCFTCDDIHEIRRSMNDSSPAVCPKCGGTKMKQAFLTAPMTLVKDSEMGDSDLDDLPGGREKRKFVDKAVKQAMRGLEQV